MRVLETALFFLEHLAAPWGDHETWRWAELMGDVPPSARAVADLIRRALDLPTAAEVIGDYQVPTKEERCRALGIENPK